MGACLAMQTIAWDVDDVLNDLMRAWFEAAWLPAHSSCSLEYGELSENPPHRLLGVSLPGYLTSLDRFRLSEMGRQLQPVPEVLEWFHRHGHQYRHIALTSTPLKSAPNVAEWVTHHFGRWIRSFNFLPSQRTDNPVFMYDNTKADYLQWWGRADIVVDDNPSLVEAAQQMGLHALAMPRPWNESRLTIAETLGLLASH